MSENERKKDDLTRREAIKTIGAGMGVLAGLPVLGSAAAVHEHLHKARQAAGSAPLPLRFFTPEENRNLVELSERIIPADDSSPGAKAARVNEFIDLIVSESPEITKRNWRAGLASVSRLSKEKFGRDFADATGAQQVDLLTEISRNERSPKTDEEKFFRTLKNATIDGYYTSEIGIKQELKYKGNTFLREFTGCTHPEHQS